MKHFALLIASILLSSCKEKTEDFGPFSLKVPSTWEYIPQQGTDSYVGLIAIDSVDTLFFDYGIHSSNLISTTIEKMLDMDTIPMNFDDFEKISEPYYSFREGNLKDSIHLKHYLTEYYQETAIQTFPAYIVTPRNIGNGSTGIFVDSVWYTPTHDGTYRLTKSFKLVGINLTHDNHYKVLEVLRTLKFKKPTSR